MLLVLEHIPSKYYFVKLHLNLGFHLYSLRSKQVLLCWLMSHVWVRSHKQLRNTFFSIQVSIKTTLVSMVESLHSWFIHTSWTYRRNFIERNKFHFFVSEYKISVMPTGKLLRSARETNVLRYFNFDSEQGRGPEKNWLNKKWMKEKSIPSCICWKLRYRENVSPVRRPLAAIKSSL